MPIRVVIADDQALFRRGLAEILAEEDVHVLAEASNGWERIIFLIKILELLFLPYLHAIK